MNRDRIPTADPVRLSALEKRIGYTFKDQSLLVRALTHSSWSNETGDPNHHLLCNERLEFLGDSVLSLIVSEYLFSRYPQKPEGDLTCMRKDVVCAEALAKYARALDIGSCLFLGIGEEKSQGREKSNVLADAFEALLAAVWVDAGQGSRAKEIVSAYLLPFVSRDLEELENRGSDSDFKTPLQQFVQQTEGDVLEYVLVGTSGPDHQKTFEVEARLNSNVVGRGIAQSKRKAEQAAAKAALQLFGLL